MYTQNFEESIVTYIAEEKSLPVKIAMDIFYKSKLAKQIHEGTYGIENMDYKYLAEDLMQNEPELFESGRRIETDKY